MRGYAVIGDRSPYTDLRKLSTMTTVKEITNPSQMSTKQVSNIITSWGLKSSIPEEYFPKV